jgi:hypothetical protein
LQSELESQIGQGSVEHLRIGGSEVLLVDSPGDGEDPTDTGSAPAAECRYRILNATLFLGDHAFAINCTGPEKTVNERASEFRGFLQSLAPVE